MDWKTLIRELQETGLSQGAIAKLCGTGQSHVCDLLHGRNKCPNWVLGDALIRLHRERVKPCEVSL
jgi:predicted transcriptional regulator